MLESKNQGASVDESLLVIHGWGMNSSVWDTIDDYLAPFFQVTYFDLPGHGESRAIQAENLSEIVDHILPLIQRPTHIMGWSLGGLVVQEIIRRHPELIKNVIIVASTPCFSQSEGWKNAMSKEVLNAFSQNLLKDTKGTIKRFIALQFMGVSGSQIIQRELRERLLKKHPAEIALMTGLEILQQQDFRNIEIKHNNLWILGEKDRLVPVEVEGDIKELFFDAKVEVILGAGHAPFMTHPEKFTDLVIKFLISN